MKIQSISYKQFNNTPQEWSLKDLDFDLNINLIVGKNATGKSRIINIIYNLSLLLSGQYIPFNSANWDIFFENNGNTIEYKLYIDKNVITEEELIFNKEILLKREKSGEGKIKFIKENKMINFQIAPYELAVVKKRDIMQHPFLEDLYLWATNLRIYKFGTDLGQNTYPILNNLQPTIDVKDSSLLEKVDNQLLRDFNQVIYVLNKGIVEFPEIFF